MARREIWIGKAVALAALLAVVGCGGGGDSAADADTAVATEQEAAPQPQESASAEQTAAEESGPVILTADDLDRYRKGRQAEIADVKKKVAALAAAKNETDTLNALGALTNDAERTQAGADAVGMSLAQYDRLTDAVDQVLGAYSMTEMMRKSQEGVDTASLPEDARAQVRQNMAQAEEGLKRLPEQNVKLVVPHAAELDSLRLLPAALALKAASGV
ncbi:MAG TPA: hypothetical protein VFK04_07540 [Gemmatimonadaceae bacterium]|jgi:hypothetical protein|nr:hypothetical protein [Gemmatimonadaceae bacterium]